jgi:hypothetical protein
MGSAPFGFHFGVVAGWQHRFIVLLRVILYRFKSARWEQMQKQISDS